MKNKYIHNQDGLSLVEFLIVISMVAVMAIVVSDFYVRRLIDYNRTFVITSLQSNTKQAVDTMEGDIKFATRVTSSNQWPDSNAPTAPGDLHSWASTNTTPATVVISVPARDASGNVIYADGLHTQLQTNDVIYYVNAQNIMYRRVVANPVSGNASKTTCPPASATPDCPADAKIVEDIASLSVVYYDATNVVTNTPANAYSIQITLQQSRTKFGRTYVSRLTSQASLRNR